MSTKKKSATKKSTVRVIGRRAAGKTHRATPAVPQADGAAADRAHADAERGKPANNFGDRKSVV